MRIILYTGKGGVGKTSVAAATALLVAERGTRTVVLSTDPAHSLGDSFDIALGPEPLLIAPNLWAQEVNVLHEIDVYWGTYSAGSTPSSPGAALIVSSPMRWPSCPAWRRCAPCCTSLARDTPTFLANADLLPIAGSSSLQSVATVVDLAFAAAFAPSRAN